MLTDNSGFIFDAIHVDKRVILLDFPGMTELLDGEKSYSTPESADQRIREILPVAHNVAELRYLLSEAFDWGRCRRSWRKFAIIIAMRLWMAKRENGRRW